MKTDVILISSKGARMENALNEVDKVADYKGLSAKNRLHLRLLRLRRCLLPIVGISRKSISVIHSIFPYA
jgi:hypothetical protein